MKVNGNDPIFETDPEGHRVGSYTPTTQSNIPIRLEIASRILGDIYIERRASLDAGVIDMDDISEVAIRRADSLIEAHNRTCKGENHDK